jgi:hypothetical protein
MRHIKTGLVVQILKIQIAFFLIIFTINVKAQNIDNSGEFGIGFGTSLTRGYTNVAKQNSNAAFSLYFAYSCNNDLSFTAELQIGQLSGGGLLVSEDLHGRKYVNNYQATVLRGDIKFSAVMTDRDYEDSWVLQMLKDCYLGTGVGMVSNKNTVQRYSIHAPSYPLAGYYKFPGSDRSVNFMIPFKLGYEYTVYNDYNERTIALDFGYVHNIVFGSGLDGYNDPRDVFRHEWEDQYRQITVGVKYYFSKGGF